MPGRVGLSPEPVEPPADDGHPDRQEHAEVAEETSKTMRSASVVTVLRFCATSASAAAACPVPNAPSKNVGNRNVIVSPHRVMKDHPQDDPGISLGRSDVRKEHECR
ncbi:hypothetical protein [Humibacillus xanthopallidus]|uniref:hypothetical protein n=1 Tax=Humibacillus xanthopallidus TaxID=412689 RepID=UPI00114E0304|nr:hypothetical protein [Humibacillus xanthopallidus]